MLSNIQIENAIKSWNERIGETMHNPVEGQISMEDAIKMGEEWLIKMNMGEKESGNSDANFTKATLSVGIQSQSDEKLLEPYYSFWTVNFSSQTMNAVLYLNAVTGKVWGAEISLYGSMHEEPYENLKLFASAWSSVRHPENFSSPYPRFCNRISRSASRYPPGSAPVPVRRRL